MVLAGGTSQTLFDLQSGSHQSAVEFLCRGTREVPGYPISGGIVKENEHGPYFARGVKSFPANEQPNQFLGTLALTGVHFDETAILSEHGCHGTLSDMAEAAMRSYVDSEEERGWSLMLFSFYPGVTKEWKNHRGEDQSVEKILARACRRPYGAQPYLGTPVIEGIAVAVSRFCQEHDAEPSKLDGVWRQGWNYLDGALRLIRKNQLENGSIPRCWFKEKPYPRSSLEWNEMLKGVWLRRFRPALSIVYPTGHILDSISPISILLGPDRDWIYNALYFTAQTIESQWVELASEISALAHAIHALKVLGKGWI